MPQTVAHTPVHQAIEHLIFNHGASVVSPTTPVTQTMSFRKRNEPLSGPRGVPGTPQPSPINSRIPLERSTLSARGPVPMGAMGGIGGRIPPGINRTGAKPAGQTKAPTAKDEAPAEVPSLGVRPSSVSSQPTVSTGCADLDKILAHQGLPLSNSLLIEESGTTDFASVLVRGFAAQGVVHNRIDKNHPACHVIVVGPPSTWANDLPGEYKGTSKEQKKAKIARDVAQVSVANMAEKDLKIAWRYGINKKKAAADPNGDGSGAGSGAGAGAPESAGAESVYEHYVTQFDITQRLVPGASAHDITFVPIATSHTTVVNQVTKIAQFHANNKKIVRIVVPGFLNPSLYPPQCSAPTFVVPFVHSLRGMLSKIPSAVLMMSLALDLYPRDGLVTKMIETLVDGVVHLQPFNPDMAALIERAYKNEPAKIQQGLVNIIKVPLLSERGMMMVTNGEYAFKNGRKKFDIDEWGIPVEDAEEPSQTKQNIDF
ncbi:hypothetical protein JCM33374_g381 [Metschnikowia sp. JCM 33374]|nr:hypothetical protein JCM33374_g381 [Metschnikowia sp. JCM 33374]